MKGLLNGIIKKLYKNNVSNEKLVQQYKNVFSGKDGEEVLLDLLKFTKVNQPTYIPGDPHTSAFNEGMRRVGLRLLSLTQQEKGNK